MKFYCNFWYCNQYRFWNFPTFWNDRTWNFNHSLIGAEITFRTNIFFRSIFSIQISNIKSLIYNCLTEEKKKAPFPGTFSKNSKRTLRFLSVLFWVISLRNTIHKYHQFLHALQSATTHELAKLRIEVYMRKSMWKENGYILAIMRKKREQKVQNIVSNKK